LASSSKRIRTVRPACVPRFSSSSTRWIRTDRPPSNS
jgi:hypothetical protein